MNEKLEKLNHEIEKTEARLRRAQHKEKMLEHQIKNLNQCVTGWKYFSNPGCSPGTADKKDGNRNRPFHVWRTTAYGEK